MKKPKKRRFSLLSWLMPKSLAGQTSTFVLIVLLATVIAVWLLRWLGRYQVDVQHAMSVGRILIEVTLALMIPVYVYWGVRWWTRVEEGLYPDIDFW